MTRYGHPGGRGVGLRSNSGVALITGLLLSVFVFILALSMLALVQNDNSFALAQERTARAYFAAYAGLDMYRLKSEAFAVGTPVTGQVPPPAGATYQQKFSVLVQASGDIRSTGSLVDGTRTLAMRTIVVPKGDFALRYEVSGP